MSMRSARCEDADHKRCLGVQCRCWCHLFDRGVYSMGSGLKYAFQKVVMNGVYAPIRGSFPVWRHVSHLKALAKLRAEHETRIRDLNTLHRREIEVEQAQLENLMPKIIKVTSGYQRDKFAGRFTVTTALSEDFVYQILQSYSRDARALDYMAERMAYDIVRQIRTLDFARTRALAEFDNGHRQQISWMNPDGIDFPPR